MSIFAICFFLRVGFSHQKLQNLYTVVYFRNKESLTNAVSNPPVDLWILVAYNKISRNYRKMVTAFCSVH